MTTDATCTQVVASLRLASSLDSFGVAPELARAWRRRRNASVVEFAALGKVVPQLGLSPRARALFDHAHETLRALPAASVSRVMGSPHALSWLRRCFECVDVMHGRSAPSRIEGRFLSGQSTAEFHDEVFGRAALLALAACALAGRSDTLPTPLPLLRPTSLAGTRWHIAPERNGALLHGYAEAPITTGCATRELSQHAVRASSIVIDPFDPWLAADASAIDGVAHAPAPAAPFEALLAEALALLSAHAPAMLDELALVYHAIAPTRASAVGFPSGTTSSSLGYSVFATPPAAPILAEMLVHEASHAHLFVAQDIDPLLAPAHHGSGWEPEALYSPWRDDPRPLNGMLHGAYVFTRVARLWMVLARQGEGESRELARRRLAVLRLQLGLASESLARHARWTDAGALFFSMLQREIAHIVEETRALNLDAVVPFYAEASSAGQTRGLASERQLTHFAAWRLRNPALDTQADESVARLAAQ